MSCGRPRLSFTKDLTLSSSLIKNSKEHESCQSGSTASINVFNDSSVISPISVNSHMYDCKVIVNDIFANDETGKSKAVNVS